MNTDDHYWEKVIDLTAIHIEQELAASKDKILSQNIIVAVDAEVRRLFHIDGSFRKKHGLSEQVPIV